MLNFEKPSGHSERSHEETERNEKPAGENLADQPDKEINPEGAKAAAEEYISKEEMQVKENDKYDRLIRKFIKGPLSIASVSFLAQNGILINSLEKAGYTPGSANAEIFQQAVKSNMPELLAVSAAAAFASAVVMAPEIKEWFAKRKAEREKKKLEAAAN